VVDRAARADRFMIRANLLPRPKETLGAFGVELDADYVRQALLGFAIVVVVAFLGIGIEQLHVRGLQTAADRFDAVLAERSSARAESKRLALEVARYQQFARQAQTSRRSGPAAAVDIARLGNGVPNRVWLESLAHSSAGYDLSGGADNVDVVSGAIVTLGRALSNNGASLVSVENRPGNGVRFDAHVGTNR